MVQLDPTDFGVYRGRLAAPAPSSSSLGTFSVQMTAEWPDGSRRETPARDAFTVQPALLGTDGRRYILRVSSAPERPVVNQPAVVRIAFVDADSGTQLEDGTSLASGAPAFVEGSLWISGGFTKPPLTPLGHGVYEGDMRLFLPGTWRVTVTLGAPFDSSYTIGTVEAVVSTPEGTQ
jgi:hypothetical protein